MTVPVSTPLLAPVTPTAGPRGAASPATSFEAVLAWAGETLLADEAAMPPSPPLTGGAEPDAALSGAAGAVATSVSADPVSADVVRGADADSAAVFLTDTPPGAARLMTGAPPVAAPEADAQAVSADADPDAGVATPLASAPHTASTVGEAAATADVVSMATPVAPAPEGVAGPARRADSETATPAAAAAGEARVPLLAASTPPSTHRASAPPDGVAVSLPAPTAASVPVAAPAASPAPPSRAPAPELTADAVRPTTTPAAPVAAVAVLTADPVEPAAPATPAARAVAAQVSPVVLGIVMRPAGTHQLTLTVNPEALGPVTIRAHIGHGGDVQVEVLSATELGREALRAIVGDLRRDLATTMPQAQLHLGGGSDTGAERGAASDAQGGSGSRSEHEQAPRRGVAPADQPVPPSPLASAAAHTPGAGLDVFA